MKIVIASDKYKGSLSALEVCSIIARTIKKLDPSINTVTSPMADGGEGTVSTLVESLGGRMVKIEVTGPLGERVSAGFGMLEDRTAVIEMASASGYVLVPPDRRNPMETTTYGTGELIKKALELGAEKIIVGIGGSATNDGGMGMAQALGYRFLGKEGQELGQGGKQLIDVAAIDTGGVTSLLSGAVIEVASDVDNPLYGKDGAAYVYGPQKGAAPGMVRELDRGLRNLAEVISRDLGKDIAGVPGAGAAGGLGAGLAAFTGAVLRPGTDIVVEVTGLEKKMEGADLVITGEGALDQQTYYGKSPLGVARLAARSGIPVITINGSVLAGRHAADRKNTSLFSGNFSIINRPMTLEQAVRDAAGLLEDAAAEIINLFLAIKKKTK